MKIVEYPHPALRHKAKPVTSIDKEIRRVVGEMLELMYAKKGLGLAAPQVALPYQVFVMNLSGDSTKREDERVYINPTISERKGIIEGEEGCLSLPGLYQKVRRAKHIRVQAYDQDGKAIDRRISEMEARVVQHETDHLHGILFIDKLSPTGRLSSRGTLEQFERDYRKAQERGEIPSNKEIQKQLKELENQPPVNGTLL